MQNFGVGMIGKVVYRLRKMCDIGYDNGYVGVWYYILNRTADVEKVFLPTKYILNSQYSVENTNTILPLDHSYYTPFYDLIKHKIQRCMYKMTV